MKTRKLILLRMLVIVATVVLVAANAPRVLADGFTQTNLVSDIPGLAATTDPDLVNPWGVSFSSGSPFWVSDNGTGLATLYQGDGTKLGLVVTVPSPGGGAGAPTGQVFSPDTASFGGSHFIFATENGSIAAWTAGTSAVLDYISPIAAVYKGLPVGSTGGGQY